jgi:hypothetical protein
MDEGAAEQGILPLVIPGETLPNNHEDQARFFANIYDNAVGLLKKYPHQASAVGVSLALTALNHIVSLPLVANEVSDLLPAAAGGAIAGVGIAKDSGKGIAGKVVGATIGGAVAAGLTSGANKFVESSLIGVGVSIVDDIPGVVAAPAAKGARSIYNVLNKK